MASHKGKDTRQFIMITLVTRPPIEGETVAQPAPLRDAGDSDMHVSLRPELRAFMTKMQGKEPTESDMVILHFYDTMESDAFRAIIVPEDLYCLAPGCGRKHVSKGAALGTLTDYDVPKEPTGCAPFIWKIYVAAKGGAAPRPRVFIGATCPDSKRCNVRASVSLEEWLHVRPLEYGYRAENHEICACCYTALGARGIACADGCGAAYYCTKTCMEAHTYIHAEQRASQATLDAKRRVCACCGRTDYALRKCSGCLAVYYCDKNCQVKHWTDGGHKAACRLAKTRDSSV
jgi:hypothetical protein